ncbi:MAG: PAS domain-containing protein [Geobacteraceae bacterium]|nr:PAS domain-containing protein [Geobacteraceae bacterium]
MKKHKEGFSRHRENVRNEYEEYLRGTLKNAPLSLFHQDRDLRYTWICNPLPGMRTSEVVGRSDDELFDQSTASELIRIKMMVLHEGRGVREEIHLRHNSDEFIFELSIEPIRDPAGAIVGVAGVALDISELRRIEKTLVRSEELTHRIIETIPDLLSVHDCNRRILYSNWHGGYGFVPPDCRAGHPLCYEAFYPEQGSPCEICHVQDVFRTGKPVFVEKYNPRIGYLEIHAYPLFDDEGQVVLVIEHIRDISERKRTEERLAKLNETFLTFGADTQENINRLVALCGEQLGAVCALYNRIEDGMLCAIGSWNAPADFVPRDKPEGHICYDLIRHKDDDLRVLRNLQDSDYAGTDPNVLRYGLKTYVGKPVTFGGSNVGSLCVVYQDDHVPTEEDKKLLGILAGAIGIEEKRKRADEEIRRLNADLEKRVAERTAQLEAANQELESFSYSVSHDLHTPLMILEGFIRELKDRYADRLDDTGRYFLERIRNAGQRMGHLIDAILRLSSLPRSEIHRETIDLSRMVTLIAAELRQREPARRIVIIVAPGILAFGDRRLIKIALENLIGNAWKYTGRQAHPVIEFGLEEKDGKRIYFIRDNGIGFSMEGAERLFVPFQRLHDLEEFPGHGIGLATVKRIIDRHGGSIWARGERGKGATFYFTLPQSAKTETNKK